MIQVSSIFSNLGTTPRANIKLAEYRINLHEAADAAPLGSTLVNVQVTSAGVDLSVPTNLSLPLCSATPPVHADEETYDCRAFTMPLQCQDVPRCRDATSDCVDESMNSVGCPVMCGAREDETDGDRPKTMHPGCNACSNYGRCVPPPPHSPHVVG